MLILPYAPAQTRPALGGTSVTLQPPSAPIPPQFIGINLLRHTYTEPLPLPEVHSWRSFDSAWYKVEPARGKWDFKHTDDIVSEALNRGVNVDFVLTSTPSWASARPTESTNRPYYPKGIRAEPANLDRYQDYVATIAKRYKGRVHTYELWNEPNTTASYSGDLRHMVTMSQVAYQTLKRIDPTITVASPGFSPYQNQAFISYFLSSGGAKTFDVLGYHFYTEASTPEKEVLLMQNLAKLTKSVGTPAKPVWNTESGYLIEASPAAKRSNLSQMPKFPHALNAQQSQDYIVRAYVLGWALHMDRFYWFSWGDDRYAVVDDQGYTQKSATVALKNLSNYLVGSRMTSCDRSSAGLWVVQLISKTGKRFEIVWSDSTVQEFKVPSIWKVKDIHTISGEKRPLSKTLLVNGTPLFMF